MQTLFSKTSALVTLVWLALPMIERASHVTKINISHLQWPQISMHRYSASEALPLQKLINQLKSKLKISIQIKILPSISRVRYHRIQLQNSSASCVVVMLWHSEPRKVNSILAPMIKPSSKSCNKFSNLMVNNSSSSKLTRHLTNKELW